MAIFHRATLTPTKAELIAAWAPTQVWGPEAAVPVDVIGSFRFDDPEGRVGMETHLVRFDDLLLQVPLTYRDEPCPDAESGFVATMQHSVLGTRWVYDGLHDPRFVELLAGVSLTGQGEALGLVVLDGRWHVAPAAVRIRGGGWGQERIAVDELVLGEDGPDGSVLRNDRLELTVFRRPTTGPQPPIGLRAHWDGAGEPVVLTSVTVHG